MDLPLLGLSGLDCFLILSVASNVFDSREDYGMDADPPNDRPASAGRRRSGWWWWLVFVVAAGLVIRSLFPQTLGEQARRTLLRALSRHYADLDVSIGSGHYDPRGRLVLEDIRFAAAGAGHPTLLSIDRLVAETDVDIRRLVDGQTPLRPRRVVISGVEANVWSDDQGRWSLQQMLPLPQVGPGCPLVLVTDARVRLMKDAAVPSRAVELRDVTMTVSKSTVGDAGQPTRIFATGSSSYVERFEIQADVSSSAFVLSGQAVKLRLERSLLQRLPAAVDGQARRLAGLDCLADVQGTLHCTPGQAARWTAKVTLHDGRFARPELPMPIEELRGVITADPGGVRIEAAQGEIGGAVCRASGQTHGLSWPCELDLRLEADNLMLEQRLAAALPPELRAQWDRLRPVGRVDLDAQVHYRGQRWGARAVVKCNGVDVSFDRFPYPVRQIVGTLHYGNGIAHAESLRGRIGGRMLRCSLRWAPPGSGEHRWFRVATDGPLTLDETLLAALTPRGEQRTGLEDFVRSLAPGGSIHLESARFETDSLERKIQTMDLRVIDGHLRYEKFPYPLYDVRGQVIVENDNVRLVGFYAQNGDAASVRCDGLWQRQAEEGSRLSLDFRGSNVPLDQTLRAALPPAARQTWDTLAPAGVLQRLAVKVEDGAAKEPLQLEITAQQLGGDQVSQQTVSLRPTALPYRLDLIGGAVRFKDGQVTIQDLDGRHDASRLAADGYCIQRDDGRWQLDLNVLTGSRLRLDSELISSLPEQVRGTFQRLQLRGPVSVRGSTRLLLPNEAHTDPEIAWDLGLQLEGNRIGDVGPVHDIRGELSISGSHTAGGVTANGTVAIDSMHVNDLQITGILGPFAIQGETLTLGAPARDARGRTALQAVRGKIFNGQLDLTGDVALSSGHFDVEFTLADADVPALMAQLNQPHSDLSGRCSGQVQLEGTVGAAHLLKGVGSGRLVEAKLYQLPLIVQLLSQLRITPNEEVAFTDGTVEFTISGDQLNFTQLQLWGSLVALHGSGTMNRMRELDLTFNTRVSPQNGWSRLIRPLGSQRYTLWTINVQGPLDSPTIERRALDSVSETLERLFLGMGRGDPPADNSASRPRIWSLR